MRLVVERDGGLTVVDDADAITEIDVRNDAVVLTIEVGGDKWTKKLPVADHAEACRVSAAIAVRCGVLVEPLAEGPDEVVSKVASEWVDGEPPRDGRWYVAMARYSWPLAIRWETNCFRVGDGTCVDVAKAHLPTPIPSR